MKGDTVKRLLCALIGLAVPVGGAVAQDEEPERPWTNVADLSLVATNGNSKVRSWALSDKFTYNFVRSQLTLVGSALKSRTTARFLSNVDGEAVAEEQTETTAEEYWLAGRYRHQIFNALFGYTNARWYRNELSGIRSRTMAALGLGYLLLDQPKHTLSFELGGNHTWEEPLAQSALTFGGLEGLVDYQYKISETALFDGDLAVIQNLKDAEDLRANLVLAVTSTVTKIFAIKISYTVLYDRQPVEVLVPSEEPGVPDAVFKFDTTDTRLAASVVVNL
jgi:putative salt-induced outer membrane protein YdiY